jgi:protoporphyrinogen oxidase
MRIAIVGAGFTGLSAAYYLSQKGHFVSVFEKEKDLGGLAAGYVKKEWDWTLDKHYHHFFANDETVFKLAKKVNQKILLIKPKTSTLINGSISQLDSPVSLIKFPFLSLLDRIRMGLALAFFRAIPTYKFFEKHKAEDFLPKIMGKKAFETIWHPLFISKFGKYAKDISLAWFWARVKKRTTKLAYPEGGLNSFAQKIMTMTHSKKANFFLSSEVVEISSGYLKFKKNGIIKKENFDQIICAIPSPVFLKIVKNIPVEYKEKLKRLKSLVATNLLLRLKKPFLPDNTYWLNICESNSKLMGVIEHTNFIDKNYYNNEVLVYVAHYVPADHRYLKMTKEQLLEELTPYLIQLNKDFRKNLIDTELTKSFFAQPVMFVKHKQNIPSFETGIPNVYLANLDQIYPWDRGINYAIELGQKISRICCE